MCNRCVRCLPSPHTLRFSSSPCCPWCKRRPFHPFRKKHFRPWNWPGQRWWRESRHYKDDSDAFLHMISNLSVFNLTLIQSNSPGGSAGKEPARREGDRGAISGVGKALGHGNGYTLLHSGLEKSTDYIVHGVAKSRTDWATFSFFHTL